METKALNPVVLSEPDYILLKNLIADTPVDGEMSLAHEIGRAVVVKEEALPRHAVRIGSRVTILDLGSETTMTLTVVLPDDVSVASNKISVLSPMGTALIGFRQGEEVVWNFNGENRTFRIEEVA